MACRVGMSKYPNTRINHWKSEEGHTHSKILATDLTYDQALAKEKSEAESRGCRYGLGGERDESSDWAVYHVWGGK